MPNLFIDRRHDRVSYRGTNVEMEAIEFEILWTMVRKPGTYFNENDLTHLDQTQSEGPSVRAALEGLAHKMNEWISFDVAKGFQFRR